MYFNNLFYIQKFKNKLMTKALSLKIISLIIKFDQIVNILKSSKTKK